MKNANWLLTNRALSVIIVGHGRYAGVAELADAQDLKSCEG